MKKMLLILILLLLIPLVSACDMGNEGNSEITGAHISDSMIGAGMMGFSYIWTFFFLYFVIGLGYVIYKVNQIENKIGRKK